MRSRALNRHCTRATGLNLSSLWTVSFGSPSMTPSMPGSTIPSATARRTADRRARSIRFAASPVGAASATVSVPKAPDMWVTILLATSVVLPEPGPPVMMSTRPSADAARRYSATRISSAYERDAYSLVPSSTNGRRGDAALSAGTQTRSGHAVTAATQSSAAAGHRSEPSPADSGAQRSMCAKSTQVCPDREVPRTSAKATHARVSTLRDAPASLNSADTARRSRDSTAPAST